MRESMVDVRRLWYGYYYVFHSLLLFPSFVLIVVGYCSYCGTIGVGKALACEIGDRWNR